jgi:putative ABC transport system permease protein
MSATVIVDEIRLAGDRPSPRRSRRQRGTALRVATRLARREVRRRPGRTALVALLVAIPVAAMVIAAVLARTGPLDGETRWHQQYGAADAIGSGPGLRGELPPGSRSASYTIDQRVLRTTANRRVDALIVEGAFSDRLADGIVRVDEGRAPAGPDEVLLAPAVARELGVGVGDTFEIDRPLTMRATVAGLGVFSQDVRKPAVAFGPGRNREPAANPMRPSTILVDLPDAPPDQVRAWVDEAGLLPFNPQRWPEDDGGPNDTAMALVLSWIAGTLVLAVAGIVIAAAFATSARRQLTTLGQLAANGAPPPLLRRVVAAQGLITGAVGTAAGIMIGGFILWAGEYRILQMFVSARDSYRFAPIDLVPIVLIALIVSTVAAAVPGRSIGRVPVLRALAGRRPLGRVPARMAGGGAVAFAAGCLLLVLTAVGFKTWSRQTTAWSLLGSVGCIAVVLGMCALTPAIVEWLERVAGRLPGEWRVAARSLGRRRSHTAAMVAAVCATAALTLAASAYVVGRRDTRPYQVTPADQVRISAARVPPDKVETDTAVSVPGDVVAAVQGELPGADVLQLTSLRPAAPELRIVPRPDRFVPDGAPGPSLRSPLPDALYWAAAPMLADDDALSALQLSEDARRQLRENGAVMTGPRSGRTAVEIKATDTAEPAHTFAAGVVPMGGDFFVGTMLITPQRAQDLGLLPGPSQTVLRNPAPLDEGEIAAVNEVRTAISLAPARSDGVQINLLIGDPQQIVSRSVVAEVGLAGGALLLTLLVIAAGLALAAAETRDERDLLVVAGAGPRTISRMSARKAVLVTVGATLLAVPAGLVPLWVTMRSVDELHFFAFPWRTVLVLVVVVPVVAGLVTRLGSAVALRVRPVRLSTMATD